MLTKTQLLAAVALVFLLVVPAISRATAPDDVQDGFALLSVKALPAIHEDGITRSAATATTTSFDSLARYTCPLSGGFLNLSCREAMFGPCSDTTPPLAVTTDRFVSLRVSIHEATDGDTWEWFWLLPDGTTIGPARTTFFAEFNGQNDCFVFGGFNGFYFCGTRSTQEEWGYSGVRDDDTAGLWNIEVRFNGQQSILEPFELFLRTARGSTKF